MNECSQDGVHSMVPRDRMSPAARKIRDTYAITPGIPFLQREFGFYCLDRWTAEGHRPPDGHWDRFFQIEDSPKWGLWGAGWCEADFAPAFEEKVLEDRGDYELVQDHAGRAVLCFKGRRSGFMPEYVDHPVKDMKSWIENCKWRLDPKTPSRWAKIEEIRQGALSGAAEGQIVTQHVAGGYMYLRSLIGPGDLLYKFYDEPELIHDCMRAWFEVADAAAARHQEFVTVDELFFGEDICYNHGSLISPDMIREFLFPYYQQLYTNIKRRNIDKRRHVFFQIDTDGYCNPVIPLYREIGVDVMSPFEVASGCDVVEIGRQYPWLVMSGGVDKRVLAQGPKAIDAMVDRIFPAMQARGGYIPTCDHGVPEEVSFENYLHYRKRCIEFA
ncbi:MAG: uroporphyrinogen decarboxylase family protein [Kiritimatiellia bacterium]